LGILASQLSGKDLSGIDGFHVHNLCECDSFATERTLKAIDEKFSEYLPQLTWLNLGGGHLMTRKGYDVEHLISALTKFKAKYPHLRIIMEPGSAVAWEAGPLVAEVVDIVENEQQIAILDISATAHMPDVLEMPYRPRVTGSGQPGEKAYTYKLGGNSCLAGDVIDEYSFDAPLKPGDRLIFEDMLHYTMVKTSFFNGVEHPHIGILRSSGEFALIKSFTYEDFKGRLS
jgi:carboxynorspermidine decarboxylase